MFRFIAAICCALFLLTNTSYAQESKLDTKGLDAAAKGWEDAFNAHDPQALSMQYVEDADANYYPDPPMKGRAAIVERYTDYFKKNPNAKAKLIPKSRRQLSPTLVVEVGDYEDSELSDPEAPYGKGHYTGILTKTDDGWLLVHDTSWPDKDMDAKESN